MVIEANQTEFLQTTLNEFSDLHDDLLRDHGAKTLVRNIAVNPNYEFTSQYQTIPGSYQSDSKSYYLGSSAYQPKQIYANYLSSGSYQFYSSKCHNAYGQVPPVSPLDLENAFGYAHAQLAILYPEYNNASDYSSATGHKEVEGRLLELVSEYFAK